MFAFNHASWRPKTTYANDRRVAGPLIHPQPRVYDADVPMNDVEDATHWGDRIDRRPPHDSADELRERFSRMLDIQQTRAEQIAAMRLSAKRRVTESDSMSATSFANPMSRSASRGVSMNCSTEKKMNRRRQQQRQRRLQQELAQLQTKMDELARRQSLADSHYLMQQTNRTGVIMDLCREYFIQFAHGYDSTNLQRAAMYAAANSFVQSVATSDIVCREYRGLDKLMDQWEIYTKYHRDVKVRLESIRRVDEDNGVVSIWCLAELDLEVSEDTLEHLYPEFHARAQQNAHSREIADALVGKRYLLSFDKVLHFNRQGKLFAHETKVHIASALMDALRDPFAAVQVLEGSAKTIDGHWKTTHVDYIKQHEDDMYCLPKYLL